MVSVAGSNDRKLIVTLYIDHDLVSHRVVGDVSGVCAQLYGAAYRTGQGVDTVSDPPVSFVVQTALRRGRGPVHRG